MSKYSISTSWRSCLYECSVQHVRFQPKHHRLKHGYFLFCMDLDELPLLTQQMRCFGENTSSIYSFQASDHLLFQSTTSGVEPGMIIGTPVDRTDTRAKASDLKRSILQWAREQGGSLPETDEAIGVTLVTLPRFLGYVFNPVSFYFLESRSPSPTPGVRPQSFGAVVEVGNTFGEQKPYWIPPTTNSESVLSRVVPKDFYVSPFSPPDIHFDFRLHRPNSELRLTVCDRANDGVILTARLAGCRRPLTDREILRLTLSYPLVTTRVIAMIHWHAFRLWQKRLPWFRKSDRMQAQRGVYRAEPQLARHRAQTSLSTSAILKPLQGNLSPISVSPTVPLSNSSTPLNPT